MTASNKPQNSKHQRRPRYSGRHPKRFSEKYKEHNQQAYPETHKHLRAKGKTPVGTHIPVLAEEVMAKLKPQPGEIIVDCTLGYGGHAVEFSKHIGPNGKLIGLDIDGAELAKTKERLDKRNIAISVYRMNFAGITAVLNDEKLDGFDIIFADLGVSSMQIDNPERGISYKDEGPLDMRMDNRLGETGADLLRKLSVEQLSTALLELSDEPDHQKIAEWIVAQRTATPITESSQLINLVLNVKGLTPKTWQKKQKAAGFGSLHPAARTFQALRIMVNDELGALAQLLRIAPSALKPGGRIGIISFHSGEDRLVKQSFRENFRQGIYESVAKNPITPRVKERMSNPRSSSAKFRWAKKAK